MAWLDLITDIEDLEDAEFDAGLVAEFERRAPAVVSRPLRFSTPTFKEYASSELQGCGKNSFPAFSITAGACALNCDHCQKKILEPMIPATNPDILDKKVRHLIETQELSGFLLSGGSNKRNEIPYSRYMPIVEKLKTDFPHLKIAVHSALLDEARAREMESAGVDTVMMDVIGAQETINEVYNLDRSVDVAHSAASVASKSSTERSRLYTSLIVSCAPMTSIMTVSTPADSISRARASSSSALCTAIFRWGKSVFSRSTIGM